MRRLQCGAKSNVQFQDIASDMKELLISIAAFLGLHLIPPIPVVRERLIAAAGRKPYLIVYSLASAGALAWVFSASQRAPDWIIWTLQPWQGVVTVFVMPVSIWMLVAGLWTRNPLSISVRKPQAVDALEPIVVITRHPVLWGFGLWAAVHIPPNGDLASVIVFGLLTAFSIAGCKLLDLKAKKRLGIEKWHQISAMTSIIPFASIAAGKSRMHVNRSFIVQIAVASAIYLWFLLYGHSWVFGIPVLVWLS